MRQASSPRPDDRAPLELCPSWLPFSAELNEKSSAITWVTEVLGNYQGSPYTCRLSLHRRRLPDGSTRALARTLGRIAAENSRQLAERGQQPLTPDRLRLRGRFVVASLALVR